MQAPLAIQIHAFAALAAFLLGLVQLARLKGTHTHRLIGYTWVGLMLFVAVSSFFIHELRHWGSFSFIHLLSISTLAMKVWRLPAATPQSLGKALVNLLPLSEGESITSILPLPEEEKTWGSLELMFATRSGSVRRNSLADFENINRNGKIAMENVDKLERGEPVAKPDKIRSLKVAADA